MIYQNDKFVFYQGFNTIEETDSFLKSLNFNNRGSLIYIRCVTESVDYIYPVTMETLSFQVLIAKDISWIRCYFNDITRKGMLLDMHNDNHIDILKYIGKYADGIEPRISRRWNDEYLKKLSEKCDISIVYKGSKCNSSYLEENSMVLLSAFLFGIIGEN